MERKIGKRIARLRKEKGLTQEQLANMLGISSPAVSKWERDSSYPDITLLCPLARALDTNVDTLLQFEEDLSMEEINDKLTEVLNTSLQEGYEAAEGMVFDLLHRYPNSAALKFNAAVVWDSFRMFFPTAEEAVQGRWRECKKKLLGEVRASGLAAYSQAAALQLATIAIGDGELERAEALLRELPEQTADPTFGWSSLYLKREEPEEALKVVQKRLYSLVRQSMTCLAMMINYKLYPDPEELLELCRIYKSVDELFGCGGMYDGMFLAVYLQENRWEEAAECLKHYIDVMTGEAVLPKRLLFTPGLELKEGRPAATKELRRVLLASLEEEEQYQKLLEIPGCREAVEKLRRSCETADPGTEFRK